MRRCKAVLEPTGLMVISKGMWEGVARDERLTLARLLAGAAVLSPFFVPYRRGCVDRLRRCLARVVVDHTEY